MKSRSGNNLAGYIAMTLVRNNMGKRLFSVRSVPSLYHPRYNHNAGKYLHRDPASRRRRRKGKSQI
jgi:hypothetical protein